MGGRKARRKSKPRSESHDFKRQNAMMRALLPERTERERKSWTAVSAYNANNENKKEAVNYSKLGLRVRARPEISKQLRGRMGCTEKTLKENRADTKGSSLVLRK